MKAGTQTVTVYKPLREIAGKAAELAVDLVKGKSPQFNASLDNGRKDVSAVFLTPILVTQQNWDIVLKDGFYTEAQIARK